MAAFTADDVARFLDRCLIDNPCWTFIDLEHPFVYTANSRLTLYADEARWAIVSEVSGFDPRAGRFWLTLTHLGNCLERLARVGDRRQFTQNIELITLIDQLAISDAVNHFATSTAPTSVAVRNDSVTVPGGTSTFTPNNESRPWPTGAQAKDIGRYVAYEYAELCRATEPEKRLHLPANLPELMTIDQWHHRRWHYAAGLEDPGPFGDAPSSYETYRLIGRALAARDPLQYRPTLPPNSHWSNWPQAGTL